MIPVIDLFAGCGGLGEGFASLLVNQNSAYSIPVSVEYDSCCLRFASPSEVLSVFLKRSRRLLPVLKRRNLA